MSQAGPLINAGNGPINIPAFGQVYNVSAQDALPGQFITFDSNGPLVNISHVAGSDTVTITADGYYNITVTLKASNPTDLELQQNGVAIATLSASTPLSPDNVYDGIVLCTAGDTIRLLNAGAFDTAQQAVAGFYNASITFVKMSTSSGGSGGAITFPADVGTANVAGGILNIFSGTSTGGVADNINTFGSGNTIEVRLNNSIYQPTTNASGTQGLYSLGGQRFMHNYSPVGIADRNTFLGRTAGNLTLTTATENTGIGADALIALTTGKFNTAVGALAGDEISTGLSNTAVGVSALTRCSTGSNNVAIGVTALSNITTTGSNVGIGNSTGVNLVTGSGNILIGNFTGQSLSNNDSNNIIIGNNGVNGDNGRIRIGTSGTHSTAFMAGIAGTPVANTNMVVIDTTTGQLGSQAIPSNVSWSVITLDQTAVINNGYFCNKAGTLLLALPAVSVVGDIIEVANINTALGIQFTQAAGQQIFIGNTNTTLGAGGTLTSSAVGDTLKLVCRAANTTWQAVSMIGNWTVV